MGRQDAGSEGSLMGRDIYGVSGGRSSKAKAVGFFCRKALNRASFFLSALRFRREENRSWYLSQAVRMWTRL